MSVIIDGTFGITTPSLNVTSNVFYTNVSYTNGYAFSNVAGSKVMTIDNRGFINKPYQPCFSAWNRGTATMTAATNAWRSWNDTFSNWNSPRWYALHDNGNNFNTSNGNFTAPIAGYYWFSIGLSGDIKNSSYLSFWKNGTYYPPYTLMYEYNAAASGYSYYVSSTLSYVFYMAAGDTMTGGGYFSSNSWASTVFYDGYVWITGYLLA